MPPTGLRVLDRRLIAGPRGLQLRQGALQVGHFGVQRRLALLQRVQENQQIGGAGGLQGVTGFRLPYLGHDRDAQQDAQQHRQCAEDDLRPPAPHRACDAIGVQLADLGRRCIRRQLVSP